MKDKISIIIPVYNCEQYISKCVNSLLNQTYTNFEILLINDGSTDNSLKVCKKFKDERVITISKKNGGASSARNVGLDNATGKYIMFVDSDDYVHNTILEVLYNNLKKYKADLSICGCTKIRNAESSIELENDEKIFEYTNFEMCTRMKSLENDEVGDVVWGKLYKASLFKNLRFVEGMMNEDAVLLHELYYNAKKGVKTTLGLYYYCVFDLNSVSRKKFSHKHLDSLKAYELRVDYYKNRNKQLYYNALKDYNTNLAFNYYLVKKHLKDKDILKNIKKEINNNTKILKECNELTFKEKIKTCGQNKFTLLYSVLLNLNLKRKETFQKLCS